MIHSVSYSRLAVFEQCKFRAHLMYEMKVAEPDRPLPAGKLEHANDRGTRVHTAAELFVQGKGPMTKEMAKDFQPEFEKLARLYQAGDVSLEGEWGHDRDWEPCDWRKAWLRLKLDALVFLSKKRAVVIDYKTGRLFGNEVKHAEQAVLYQICTFLRFPELEEVTTEFWYLDQPPENIKTMTYRRDQGLRFKRKWDERLNALTTAVDFPASPSIFACRYCMFSNRPGGTGHCSRGVIP